MPLIAINTSRELSKEEVIALKVRLGQTVAIIPGKSEETLLVDISTGHFMYKQGRELTNGAQVDVRIYKAAELEHKKAFTEAVFSDLHEILGMDKNDIYLEIMEFDNWGTAGSLK